jgi:hypothetical protein
MDVMGNTDIRINVLVCSVASVNGSRVLPSGHRIPILIGWFVNEPFRCTKRLCEGLLTDTDIIVFDCRFLLIMFRCWTVSMGVQGVARTLPKPSLRAANADASGRSEDIIP